MNGTTLTATLAMLAAIAAAVAAIRLRRRPAWVTAVVLVAMAVSLVVTFANSAAAARREAFEWGYQSVLVLVEFVALLALLATVVRTAPFRHAAATAVAATAASSTLILRLIVPASVADALSACMLWALGAVGAICVGAFLRTQDIRRRSAVAETRRVERQRVADDLHDFVAHDLSEMLANAQVGRILSEREPRRAVELFADIESAGQRAMSAMDRLVALNREIAYDLAGVRDLTERFANSSQAQVKLDLDPDLAECVGRELALTIYRTVSEALTNIRRHAPAATEVTIAVERTGGWLALTVGNDRPEPLPGGGSRLGGGSGLISLTERAEALGGRLTAGRVADRWQLRLLLPLDLTG